MSSLRNTILGTTVLLAGTILVGCNNPTLVQRMDRDMSRQSDAYQAWWEQQVVYHRSANVYYSPTLKTYWWFENETWQEGSTRPANLFAKEGTDVQVVKLSRLLKASINSPEVMAFNPHYLPTQELDPVNEFAPAQNEMLPIMAETEAELDPQSESQSETALQTESQTASQTELEPGFFELEAQAEAQAENQIERMHGAFPEAETEATTLVDDENQ